MKNLLKTLQATSVAALTALSFNAMAGDTFTMNGRSFQLEPPSNVQDKARSGATPQGKVTVRDLTSGQISVYAEGLIITLKDAGNLKPVLHDYPALSLQYAPGAYAYVKVSRDRLATTFDALSADPRIAAVHLRPVPVQIRPR